MSSKNPTGEASSGMDFLPVMGAAGFADTSLLVIGSARFEIVLATVDLDRRLYGGEVLVDRLRSFILQHRRARLRVLVHDPAGAVRNCVRLVEFSRLLSSRIEVRQMPASKRGLREEMLIADDRALLYRGSPDQDEAKFYSQAPLVARSHLRAFDLAWNDATVAREFTALRL